MQTKPTHILNICKTYTKTFPISNLWFYRREKKMATR